jgi:tetratricopeptide (TPR) repeat protein
VTDSTTPFHPPSPEQLQAHLRRCGPRRTVQPRQILLSICVIALAIWMLGAGHPLLSLVPWLLLVGLLIYMSVRARRQQTLLRQVRRISELAMLRRSVEALRAAWQLLPSLSAMPQAHGQVVTVLTSVLAHLRAYETALVACDYLLPHIPPDHPASYMIRAQRLLALLHTDRLTDADDAIRNLRSAGLDPLSAAMLRTAELYRQIITRHNEDAAASADDAIASLQPLGVDAGFGYALLATAYFRLDDAEHARAWWRRATLLLPPAAIFDALPETSPLADLPASPTVHQFLRAAPPWPEASHG